MIRVAIVIPEMGFDDVPMSPVIRDETVTKKKPKTTIRTPSMAAKSTASSVRFTASARVAASGDTNPPRAKRGSRWRPVAMQ